MRVRLAILFANFGPYHVARISALSQHCVPLPIEVRAESAEYRWGGGTFQRFERTTLVESTELRSITSAEIRRRLVGHLERLAPDVIAVPGWHDTISLAAIRWARTAGVAVVMMSESTRNDERRYMHRELVKRQIVGLCSAAMVGGSLHAEYVQQLGLAPSRIVDGYDVVDNAHFANGADLARASEAARRQEFGLPDNYFLASSRFIARKNLLWLIDAYELYRRQVTNSPWNLVILGYGPLEAALRDRVSSRGLESSVSIDGFQPYGRLPIYYGLSGAFIHPALKEPWGLVVNEAMAAGVSVLVSSAAGCAPDLVVHGETGFQFNPTDTAQLAGQMSRISGEPDLRRQMAERARVHVADWSPARFGRNLARAAHLARSEQSAQAPMLARLCLQLLLHRVS